MSVDGERVDGERVDWRGACLTALVAWLCLYPSVLVGLHWHDTSEFIASGRALSLAHPPGHPLTLLGIHLSQLLPWFDASARAHLASSFWGALGVGAAYIGIQLLLMRDTVSYRPSYAPSLRARFTYAIGALTMISPPLVWLQVIRAEVYAPQWSLTIWVWSALFFAARTQDLRGLLVAALSLGLLATNHTLLTVAIMIALLPRLLTWRLSLRVWLMSCLCFLGGLSLYLYVWLRGHQGGVSGWGWIDSFSDFWNHISAKVWQVQVGQRAQEVNWSDNLVRMLGFALEQVGLLCGLLCSLLLVLGGVRWSRKTLNHYNLLSQSEDQSTLPDKASHEISGETSVEILRGRGQREFILTTNWGPTLVLATAMIMLTKLTYPFSAQNPDFSGYLAAGVPSFIFLLVSVARTLRRDGALIILTLVLLGSSTQRDSRRSPMSMGAEAWGRQITTEVSAGGTLWSSFYATHFITGALWVTEGWRPDIRLVFRGHRKMNWAFRRSNLIPALRPLTELSSLRALSAPGSRHEVERPLDLAPDLWSRLSLTGAERGSLTCKILPENQKQFSDIDLHVTRDDLIYQLHRQLTLGDARIDQYLEQLPQQNLHSTSPVLYLSDEDTAYAWALHHEMSVRWLSARISETEDALYQGHLASAIAAHQGLRTWWIQQIALDRWDQLHFSSSHP